MYRRLHLLTFSTNLFGFSCAKLPFDALDTFFKAFPTFSIITAICNCHSFAYTTPNIKK